MKLALGVALIAVGALSHTPMAHSFTIEKLYEAGTDAGMLFLAEHSGRLRILLLAEECGHNLVAETLRGGFPQTVHFAVSADPVRSIPHEFQPIAAEVARAYVVGYETGVRTEFQRQPSEYQRHTCEVVAMAGGSIISGDQ